METYTIYTDGGSRGNPGPSGAGGLIKNSSDFVVGTVSEYLGVQTNNYAEYKALELTLQLAVILSIKKVVINMDSRLIVEQLNGRWAVKNEKLLVIYENIVDLLTNFDSFEIKHIYRNLNTEADALANKAMDSNNSNNSKNK
jgi:ribonuclease HI